MDQARGIGLSPNSVGWLVAVIGFFGSFVIRILMYVPWMVAIHLTGETTGMPETATFLIALFLLALQWAAVGYVGAMVYARMSKGAKGDP